MTKVKILYVEDEVFLGKIVRESLVSKGYDVCMVQDGKQVLSEALQFAPDLCILDIMLPSVDGYTLAKQIKNEFRQVPIIFVSAKNQTEDVVKGFEAGGSDYLRKPFSIEELVVRIDSLLLRSDAKDRSMVEVEIGDFLYRPRELKLINKDTSVELSHRTNEVLNYLFEHRNQVIDRRRLLIKLWGDDSYFNSRNLDVYIKKVRDYLSPDPKIKIITLKGVGYRFLIDS